jgi:hypothetical protein
MSCIAGQWVEIGGASGSANFQANQLGTGIQGRTGDLLGTTSGAGTSFIGGGTGGVRRIPVVIQATGDDTLEMIFKSMAYEAFVEIVE